MPLSKMPTRSGQTEISASLHPRGPAIPTSQGQVEIATTCSISTQNSMYPPSSESLVPKQSARTTGPKRL